MIMLQYVSYDVAVEIFRMFHMLHIDVVKEDLDVVLSYLLQVFYLDVASSMRNLNVPSNMKHMLQWVFSSSSTDG